MIKSVFQRNGQVYFCMCRYCNYVKAPSDFFSLYLVCMFILWLFYSLIRYFHMTLERLKVACVRSNLYKCSAVLMVKSWLLCTCVFCEFMQLELRSGSFGTHPKRREKHVAGGRVKRESPCWLYCEFLSTMACNGSAIFRHVCTQSKDCCCWGGFLLLLLQVML